MLNDNAFAFGAGGCVFEDNTATGEGGALYSTGESFEYYGGSLSECTFLRNEATDGGAARLNYYDHFYLCTCLGNEATNRGGALFLVNFQFNSDIDNGNYNGIFAGNRAGSAGGAIYCQGIHTALYNATFALNEAPQGAHVAASLSLSNFYLFNAILAFGITGSAAAGPGTLGLYCSDVFGNDGGDYVGPLSGREDVNGNFSADPLFCDAIAYDLTLREGSPCLSTPCGHVGVLGLGCGPIAVEARSWGGIKALYR